jgi:hypothetical protein
MCALSSMAVLYSFWILCFAGMLLRYFLNDFEMVSVAPIVVVVVLGVNPSAPCHRKPV